MKMFNRIFSMIKSFVPDYQLLMKLGYRATTYNQEFILEKKVDRVVIRVHQSVEPFNPILSSFINFELNDNACVVLDGTQISEEVLSQIFELVKSHFDHSHLRIPYLFLYDKKMELTSSKLPGKLEDLERFVKQIV